MTRVAPLLWLIALGGHFLCADLAAAQDGPPQRLDCEQLDCAGVLPGATQFERTAAVYAVGKDARGALVGWVVLSTDVVSVKAYSGKPLVTLVGLDTDGVIVGVRVVHHSEPILLLGIPASELRDFAAFYVGKHATTRVVVGRSNDPDAVAVDAISGATVTTLAQNRTILETARGLGAAVGVVDLRDVVPGHFVEAGELWSWDRMVDEEVFGRLTVSEADMGARGGDRPFIDLWFTLADAPQVGRALVGDANYDYYRSQMSQSDHMLVVLSNGSGSFKGSAFVRGGLFDRVRIAQGLAEVMFRDTDYWNLARVHARGAPRFKEGAVFLTRGGRIDPGTAFDMVFLGSRYVRGPGAFSREHRSFSASFRMPRSVYVTEGPDRDEGMWVQAWRNRKWDAVVLSLYLLLVTAVFAARRWSTSSVRLLGRLHTTSMVLGFVLVGVLLKAQPSVTQMLTLVDAALHEWRWGLFASEPLIFLMWIFIAIVSLIWGRGVFCGWVCPYGVLTELIHKVTRVLKFPSYELPDSVHRWARYFRYVVLVGLIPVFLWSPEVGERLAEVEPFKSTFLVPAWTRHWGFFLWWLFLLGVSSVWWRPFCRYLCPLGAGLALYNSFRFAGPYRRSFCSSCKVCAKGCEPRAIDPDGKIDARECLGCFECEATYRDEQRCPPLVGIARLSHKAALSDHERVKLAELETQARRL